MGKPTTGKSTAVKSMAGDKGVVYLNTDLKEVPFKVPKKTGFKQLNISDAEDIIQAIEEIEEMPEVHTVILDTITFLMDQYEMQYVVTATDTRAAWGQYGKFYKSVMHNIKAGSKNYIILAHAKDVHNEKEMSIETKVPIKGAVGATGIEADFTTILATKVVEIDDLEGYENDLLNISAREKALGIKYVFQTYITKDTIHEKMRSHMDLWDDSELYIDNDISNVVNRIEEYYKG